MISKNTLIQYNHELGFAFFGSCFLVVFFFQYFLTATNSYFSFGKLVVGDTQSPSMLCLCWLMASIIWFGDLTSEFGGQYSSYLWHCVLSFARETILCFGMSR